MAKRKATTEELGARAETNGYKRGAHREKDSTRDNGKHNKKTKRSKMRCHNNRLFPAGVDDPTSHLSPFHEPRGITSATQTVPIQKHTSLGVTGSSRTSRRTV